MRTISAGTSFDTTDTIPRPPTDITGSVSASSPDSTRNRGGTARHNSNICVTLPDASLTPVMFAIAVRRTTVLTSTLQPVRPGTLYATIGSGTAFAIAW